MERTKITKKETIGLIVVMYIMLFVGMIYGWVMGWCAKEREEEFEEV